MFDTPTLTPIKPNQTRAYLGGAGYEHPCLIKEVHAKHVLIELKGNEFEMPLHTIGRELEDGK